MLSCFNYPVYPVSSRRFIYLFGYFHLRPVLCRRPAHRCALSASHVAIDAVDRPGGGFVQKIRLGLSPGFIQSSPVATAATLNGDAEIQCDGRDR